MLKLRIPLWIAFSCCAMGLPACDSGAGDSAGAKDGAGKNGAGKDGAKGAETLVEGAVDDAEQKAGAVALFDPEDKAFRKRACEFLTPEMVASVFEVPAAELKQRKMMGCMYTWEKDGEIVDAKVMMPRVHKTLDGAKLWFENATATKTAEQIDAELDQAKAKVQEHEALDTKMKKKVAGDLTGLAKLSTPEQGVRYDGVPEIGDQARVSSADGVLWVRLGNLTFQVTGYKGPGQPRAEFDPTNPKAIVKAAMEAQKKWIADTIDQRKVGSSKLAPKVVEAIQNL